MKNTSRLQILRQLHADQSGSVLIWVTAMIFVIFGLLALGVDGARYINLNSNMQQIADAAALSGAKSLDGSDQAIENARIAAQTYLSNNLPGSWSDIASTGSSQIATVTFRETLTGPALGDADDQKAVYIEVKTISRGFNTTFARIFGAKDAFTTASAVARVKYSVCQPVQAFICNPYEDTNPNPGTAENWMTNATPGQMVFLAGGTSTATGNWGLIDPTAGGGDVAALSPYWASNSLAKCEALTITDLTKTNDVLTGNKADKAVDGMNVRFDKSYSSGYAAAPITIDGWENNPCANPKAATPTGFKQTNEDSAAYISSCTNNAGSCPLPRDRNLVLPGASWTNPDLPPMGIGPNIADLKAYWTNHHPTVDYPQVGGVDIKTRYELYKLEVQNRDTVGYFANNGSEKEKPECVTETTASKKDVTRRLINVAVVDCTYWKIKGGSKDLPIINTTARFFMTEPATDKWTDDTVKLNPSLSGRIYAEYVDSAVINQEGGSVFQIVELVQ